MGQRHDERESTGVYRAELRPAHHVPASPACVFLELSSWCRVLPVQSPLID